MLPQYGGEVDMWICGYVVCCWVRGRQGSVRQVEVVEQETIETTETTEAVLGICQVVQSSYGSHSVIYSRDCLLSRTFEVLIPTGELQKSSNYVTQHLLIQRCASSPSIFTSRNPEKLTQR